MDRKPEVDMILRYRPTYRCKDLENFTELAGNGINMFGISEAIYIHLNYQKCSIDVYNNRTGNTTALGSVSCLNGYEYNTIKEASFVTEWDLVCDREELAELTQTLIILGQGFGAATLTTFADRYGRKPVHIISHIFIFGFGLGMAFSPNFYVLAPLRFLTGVAQQGVVLTTTILNIERFPMETRGFMEPIGGFGWTAGAMILPLISYILKDVSWRYIQIVMSLWSAYSLVQYWLIDESLRWLVANGKTKKATRVVKKACRWNKVEYKSLIDELNLDEDLLVKVSSGSISDLIDNPLTVGINQTHDSFHPNVDQSPEGTIEKKPKIDITVRKYTILDILKSKRLLLNSCILWYAWIVDSLSYYGLYIISSTLAGDRFVNFFLSALVEIPSMFVLLALINRIGRKRTSITFHAIAGITLLIGTAILSTANGNRAALTASTAFALIGKFGASGSFAAEFCYTPELYPTNLRNAGLGVSSALSRLGGMMSPFARTLAAYIIWGPGLVFGIMCLLVTVLMPFLPETRGRELPDTRYTPSHRCKEIQNITELNSLGVNVTDPLSLHLDYMECSIGIFDNTTGNLTAVDSIGCVNGYQYNGFKELSFVTEWDLVCDKKVLAKLTQTLIILGQGIGAGFITTFADQYGRKPVHIVSHFFILILGIGTAFSGNFYILAPLRVLTGMSQQGVVLTSTILNIERFPKEVRGLVEPFNLLSWATGCMLIPLVAFIFKNFSWRYTQFVLSVWSIYSIVQNWMIDESLRWLVANGKTMEARKIVEKACRMNRVDCTSFLDKCGLNEDLSIELSRGQSCKDTNSVPKTNEFPKDEQEKDIKVQQYTILNILTNRRLLFSSLILWYTWFVDSLSYYGLFLISSKLAGDRYINFFLSSLVEVPAAFLLMGLINRIGRRCTSITFHAITAVALLIGTALMTTANNDSAMSIAATAFSTIGKFGATGAFLAVFIYTPELYPTNIRNTGLGVSSALSRLGGMLAPFAETLATYIIWGPGLIFGVMCLLAGALLTRLPETRGYELPDSMEELSGWYKSMKIREKYKKEETNVQFHVER
ncbi:hypothetical protein ScPMuIL_018401 [Solemya velum]